MAESINSVSHGPNWQAWDMGKSQCYDSLNPNRAAGSISEVHSEGRIHHPWVAPISVLIVFSWTIVASLKWNSASLKVIWLQMLIVSDNYSKRKTYTATHSLIDPTQALVCSQANKRNELSRAREMDQ